MASKLAAGVGKYISHRAGQSICTLLADLLSFLRILLSPFRPLVVTYALDGAGLVFFDGVDAW
jgi:hypothetical protein